LNFVDTKFSFILQKVPIPGLSNSEQSCKENLKSNKQPWDAACNVTFSRHSSCLILQGFLVILCNKSNISMSVKSYLIND